MIHCDGYSAYGMIQDIILVCCLAHCRRKFYEAPIWEEFWSWIDTLNPTVGSKIEKAVNYANNHHETLMNYMLDGRCEISNNAAERQVKTYVMGRKAFLFHDTTDGIVLTD
jgi:hypothetical protein